MIRTRLLIAVAVGCLALALALHGRTIDRTWFAVVNATLWTWLPPATLSCVTLMGHGLAATMLMSPTLLLSTRTLAAALWSAPVALALSRLPKAMVDSPRPAAVLDAASMHLEGQALLGHNSFPSGHSITAFMLVSVLLLALPGRLRPATAAAAAAIVAFGVAVALSRLGVGAHWPSDVIAGAGLGLLAGVAGSALAQRWPLPEGRRTRAVLALLLGAGAVQLARVDTGYPGAQPAQWLLAAAGGGIALAALWRAARPAPQSAAGAGAR